MPTPRNPLPNTGPYTPPAVVNPTFPAPRITGIEGPLHTADAAKLVDILRLLYPIHSQVPARPGDISAHIRNNQPVADRQTLTMAAKQFPGTGPYRPPGIVGPMEQNPPGYGGGSGGTIATNVLENPKLAGYWDWINAIGKLYPGPVVNRGNLGGPGPIRNSQAVADRQTLTMGAKARPDPPLRLGAYNPPYHVVPAEEDPAGALDVNNPGAFFEPANNIGLGRAGLIKLLLSLYPHAPGYVGPINPRGNISNSQAIGDRSPTTMGASEHPHWSGSSSPSFFEGKGPGDKFTYRGPKGPGVGHIGADGKPYNEKGQELYGPGNPFPLEGLKERIAAELATGEYEYVDPLPAKAPDSIPPWMGSHAIGDRPVTTMTNPLPSYTPPAMVNTPLAQQLRAMINHALARRGLHPLINAPLPVGPTQMGRL